MPNKPKDFSESAVNLVNPVAVKALLEKLSKSQLALEKLEGQRDAELEMKIGKVNKVVFDIQAKIRVAVEEQGSYQDVENERYAVKYARKTEGYNLEPFKTQFPKFVELCVRETIDVQALKGQIKGKLITVKELEDAGVLEYSTTFAFYVR